ncbi:hypothetical protein [Neobacillus rhizophilus]|uniref:Uncharacterized protein n=1 Tax=Neobacillus rhizophilus TaxID=2833579 RepID=A0A942U1A8_9BACI|nr:hypothetical protein [Neobacillus rhizophilus]MBS4212736.1 hypothetical protein [Neobacillus rhizophilus]
MKRALVELQNDSRFLVYLNNFHKEYFQDLSAGDYVGNDLLFLLVTSQAVKNNDMAVKLVEASSYKDYVVGEFLREYFNLKTNNHFEILKSFNSKMKESAVISLLGALFDISGLCLMIRMDDARSLSKIRNQRAILRKQYREEAKSNIKKLKQHRRQPNTWKKLSLIQFFTFKKPMQSKKTLTNETYSKTPATATTKTKAKNNFALNLKRFKFTGQVTYLRKYSDDMMEMKVEFIKGELKLNDRAAIRYKVNGKALDYVWIKDIKEWNNGYKPVTAAKKAGIYYIYFYSSGGSSSLVYEDMKQLLLVRE